MDTARESAGPTQRNPSGSVLQFAGFTVDFSGMSLLDAAGREVPLRRSEFALLRAFLAAPGRVLAREFLLDAVSGRRAEAFDRTIDVLVGRLRGKIEADPKAPRLIQTVIGVGYKFTARPTAPPIEAAPDAAPMQVPGQPPAASLERRQVTVLRCAIDRFGEIAVRLEPEDLHELLGGYRRCCGAIIQQHGGHALHWVGDELVALFGYPEASEHAAEHAVRAGLALVDAATRLDAAGGTKLVARAAIATGSVLMAGTLASENPECLGDAPVLAQRLLAVDAPGGVVIAGTTHALVGGLFDTRPLPGGAADPAGVLVLGESHIASRFEALRGAALTLLVGRAEELALLRRRWDQAKAGAGRLVLLGGEPGIGKSRLVAELGRSLLGEAPVTVSCFCSPHHRDSAYHPILRHLEHAARFARGDDAATRLGKLRTLLAPSGAEPEAVALLADALSVPTEGVLPPLALSPRQRRDRFTAALLAQAEHLARRAGLLVLFEDLHWIDPSSQEVLDALVARIAALPVLLVATHRTEFVPPWASLPQASTVLLTRLDDADSARIVADVAGSALAADAAGEIVAHAEGVPLFLEELAKAAVEGDGGPVPASLRDSLTARLDRLPTAKRVAQLGSVIGRSFSHYLIEAIADAPVSAGLDALVTSGLAGRRGVDMEAMYTFKHALVQDAAYASLPRDRRAALHGRIVDALIALEPGIEDSQPELLAHHSTEAGLIQKAASLSGKAGQQSLARSALVEAEAQLTRALTQIATLAGTPALRREQIKLLIGLANAQMHTKGYAAPDTKASLEQARVLIEGAAARGEPAEDQLILFSVLYGFWITNLVAFNGDALRELAAEFLAIAKKQMATVPLMIGYRLVGTSSVLTGDVAGGRAHLDRAIALYVPREHRSLATRFASDIRVNILVSRSVALCCLGYPDAARTDAARALGDAREIGHAPTLMVALFWGALTHSHRRDYATANAQLDELVALANEKGTQFWKTLGMMIQICVFTLAGQASDPVALITSSIAAFRSTGASNWIPLCLSVLASAYAQLGHFDDAWRCVDEAMATVEATRERWNEANIHRIAGEIALMSPEPDTAKAEAYFGRALAVARRQGAKLWELQAATSYAGLLRDQDRPDAAAALLAPVYNWFTEGFDTVPLRAAKSVLDGLPAP